MILICIVVIYAQLTSFVNSELHFVFSLRRVIRPSLDYSYRKENSLEITIAEAKNLPVKRK